MYKQEKKYYKQAFLIAFIMACVLLLPLVIMGGGRLVYYGDFNEQQIPFYQTCIKAIHSGETGWNWYTDLGVNFISAYGFYTLGSPFFWLAAIFPAQVSHYLMAPLLALKFGCCSLTAYAYIARFVKKPQSALIGGILYAFSGYALYNMVFNHFLDVMCFFPLLLIALEEAVLNKRRSVFAAAVAINALVNYFFFFGEVVFLVIYFLIRMAMSEDFRIGARDFLCLGFESVVGVLIAGVLMLPAVLQLMGSTRAGSLLTDKAFLYYEEPAYYGNILKSMFFITDIAGQNTLCPWIHYNWNSTAMYLPLFSMTGVIAFFCGVKKHWAKLLLTVCLVMAFIPGLNSMFTMMNSMYYARWFYMPMLICCMITVYALENDERFPWKTGLAINAAIVAVMSLLYIFCPVDKSFECEYADGTTEQISAVYPQFMTINMNDVYIYVGVTAALLLAMYLFIRSRHRFTKQKYMRIMLAATVVCSMGLSCAVVIKGMDGIDADAYTKADAARVTIDDDSAYRVDIINDAYYYNLNMLWDMYSAKSFNSIVPNSISEIYEYLSFGERAMSSEQDFAYTAMRSLFGVKYAVVNSQMYTPEALAKTNGVKISIISNNNYNPENKSAEENISELMTYFTIIDKQGDYYILLNECYVPLGFAYDEYIRYEDTEDKVYEDLFTQHTLVDRIALECVALTDEQIEKYCDILTETTADISSESWTDWRMYKDAEARRADGVKDFSFGKNSFTAATDYESDKLVVFSVPYDEGWKAFIDGEPAEIDKVNGGFIAIRVSAGEHSIEFKYTTPGLALGLVCTIGGLLLLALWTVAWYVILHKGSIKRSGGGVSAHRLYLDSQP